MEGLVIVFDFDKTIINCDSDNWVIDELGFNDLFNQLLPTLPWNALMDRMMMELHSKGKTMEDIAKCLKQVPLHPSCISAIKSAHYLGCDLRILSDANVYFIKTILEHHKLLDYFSQIQTNPSFIDGIGRLRVLSYHDFNSSSSHGCNICPPNMCKGLVIERMREVEQKKQLIYVGDGKADFCAGLKLKQGDCLMPRKHFPIWEMICKIPLLVKAQILEWNNWEEFETKLINTINTFNNEHHYKRIDIDDNNLITFDCDCKETSISTHSKTLQ